MHTEDKKQGKSSGPKFSKEQVKAIGEIAKMIALRCVRNTSIEEIHAGKSPKTQTGHYSDVKVVTPFGDIPWTEVSRMTDTEMKSFNKEVINKIFTVLIYLNHGQEMPRGPLAFYPPHDWDDPEIDPEIAKIFDHHAAPASDFSK